MININPLSELDGSNLDFGDSDLITAIKLSRMDGDTVVSIGKHRSVGASKLLMDNLGNSPVLSSVSFSMNDRYNYLTNYYFSQDTD